MLSAWLNKGKLILPVFLHRAWQAGSGVVTLGLIGIFLSPVEQGFYYTFASLAAIQTVLDMGLSVVLVHIAAHKFQGLAWGTQGELSGEHGNAFLALAKATLKWYGIAAALLLLLIPFGFSFFAGQVALLTQDLSWQAAWVLLVVATAASLAYLPLMAILEGSGEVIPVYRLRLCQSVAGATAAWIMLLSGHGLYAVAMMPLMNAILGLGWLLYYRRQWLIQVYQAQLAGFSWKSEVWPLQWRVGVSWVCGYCLTQLYTPILFKTQGPILAGQMGLTMTVVNMLGLLAMSALTAKTPLMASLASTQQHQSVQQVFYRALAFLLGFFSLGAIAFLVLCLVLNGTAYGTRLLPWGQVLSLQLAIMASSVINALAVYFRAYRQERLMPLYIANTALVLFAAYLLAPSWGSAGVIGALFIVNVLIMLPTALAIWAKFRQRLSVSS